MLAVSFCCLSYHLHKNLYDVNCELLWLGPALPVSPFVFICNAYILIFFIGYAARLSAHYEPGLGYWIGASDHKQETVFQWTNGRGVTFTSKLHCFLCSISRCSARGPADRLDRQLALISDDELPSPSPRPARRGFPRVCLHSVHLIRRGAIVKRIVMPTGSSLKLHKANTRSPFGARRCFACHSSPCCHPYYRLSASSRF